MKKIKINIQLFGGRGAYSYGGSTKGGKLKKGRRSPSEQLDVSSLAGFPVKIQNEFEKFLDMKSNAVEYGYLIDKNGKVVAGARGGKHSVGIAYEGSQEGMLFTHNHPSGYGGTFSGEDISHLTESRLRGIRAVAREGTYSISAKKGANYDGLNRALARDLGKIEKAGVSKASKYRASGKSSNEVRKAYVDVLHKWYQTNASKYGFTYTFTPNKEYNIKTRRKLRK